MPGCGRQDQRPSGPEGAALGWKIQLEALKLLPASKPVELTARIHDAAGRPLEGLEVELSLNMTSMNMGENITRLTQREPGAYAGKVVFTMKGPWEAVLRASKGSERATKMFHYTVK